MDDMDKATTPPAAEEVRPRRPSSSHASHASDDSHTALDFLRSQTQLEADAREALPYRIELCTNPLGPLRQAVYACLDCCPPPPDDREDDEKDDYSNAAGICYACSVQCHGDHTLVELFNKRNFVCDCGTTRFAGGGKAPCTLRVNSKTNAKGVCGEEPAAANQYNHNFRNRFCGCGIEYDPFQQKGTMFQCLGLGTRATGGCGEDWWHPGCVVGVGATWFEGGVEDADKKKKGVEGVDGAEDDKEKATLPTIAEDANDAASDTSDPPMPPGFPPEDDFDGFICYKCVDAFPWIKQYANAPCFLPPVFYKPGAAPADAVPADAAPTSAATLSVPAADTVSMTSAASAGKRKAEDDNDSDSGTGTVKRARSEVPEVAGTVETAETAETNQTAVEAGTKQTADQADKAATAVSAPPVAPPCKLSSVPPPPPGQFSLFFKENFRDQLCRCTACFPLLKAHPQLLEEEDIYEPPVSEDAESEAAAGGSTDHGGSLYERGESALQNVDRVRALEGVMAYNHLKDKLKPFFQTFAESGQAISAEDIKAYFAKLRGDEQGMQAAASDAAEAAQRREQEGY